MSSPSATHRSPALAYVLAAVLRNRSDGTRRALPEDLAGLVESAHTSEPRLWAVTDSIPLDPRRDVRTRWRQELFRIHPGMLERPVATVRKAGIVSSAIDQGLHEFQGFGLSDVVEVLLRYADETTTMFAPLWQGDLAANPTDRPIVTAEEVAACAGLPDLADYISSCSDPNAAQRAVEWLTKPVRQVEVDPVAADSWFGTVMRVSGTPFGTVTLPAPLVPEIIDAAAGALAAKAAGFGGDCGRSFQAAAFETVGRALERLGMGLVSHPRLPDGGHLHSLVRFADRTFLAVDVLTTLTGKIEPTLENRYKRLCRLAPNMTVATTSGDTMVIPEDARLGRLLVIAHPQHVAILGEGGAIMTLEDVDWITDRVREEPDAFFRFCSDLAEPPGVGELLTFETINLFEHWWENGQSLHRAGVDFQFMTVEFHRGAAEWDKAAAELPLEQAFMSLNLPSPAWWPHQKVTEKGLEVFDLPTTTFWIVRPGTIDVAVGGCFRSVDKRLQPYLEPLSRQIAWKLEKIAETEPKWAPLSAIRISLIGRSDNPSPPVMLAGARMRHGVPEVRISLSEAGVELLEADTPKCEAAIGSQLASGIAVLVDGEFEETKFVALWDAAPPGIRVDPFSLPQVVREPEDAQRPDPASRSARRRDLARALAQKGATPGRRVGTEASRFESTFVFPTLRKLLHETMAPFASASIVGTALEELERSHAERARRERELAFRQRLPVALVDAREESARIANEATTLTRAIELVLEEALCRPPSGVSVPDRMQWREVLAVADLILASGLRSEDAHLRLRPVAVEVSSAFEIRELDDGPEPLIDLDAFVSAVSESREIGTVVPFLQEEDISTAEATDSGDRASILEGLPALRPISEAMGAELGFSLDTLLRVPFDLRSWPIRKGQMVSWETLDDVVSFCVGASTGPDTEVRTAIGFLSLDTNALAAGSVLEHWEQERRAVRTATRPFIRDADGRLAVRPWAFEGFIRRLLRYLGDGRLPWPAKTLPARVGTTLDQYRKRRNELLEDDVYATAVGLDMVARRRIRKPKNIGLNHIPGEIDVVAVDERASRIWVIEVKDPFEAFSSAQVRYLIDDFHDDAKDRSHVAKLIAKADAVAVDPITVAETLGVARPRRAWEVVPLMVTRHPIAPCFVRNSRVAFSWLDKVDETLARN